MSLPAPPINFVHTPELPFDPNVATYTRFTSRAGSFEPYEYTGWIDECISWKETCYIGDWSPLRNKFYVKGPDALKFFSDVSINSFAKTEVGQAKHVVMCNDAGKVVTEGVFMRLAEDEHIYTSGPTLWTAFQFEKGKYNATATQRGFEQFIFQLQGPSSLHVLEKATGERLRDINFMRFRESGIGSRRFHVLRQGMSGDIGFELHGNSEDAVEIYNAILAAGRDFGIRRLGGRAKMVNHVEACFPTPSVDFIPAMYGEGEYMAYVREHAPQSATGVMPSAGSFDSADVSDFYRSPFELGWGRSVKFDHKFIGRGALEAEAADPKRTMVTLIWHKDDVIDVYASLFREEPPYDVMELPRTLLGCVVANKVLQQGSMVGVSTSSCYSYFFRKMISLCVIDVERGAPGTDVTMIWGRPGGPQKEIRATVAPAPFKQDRRRIDIASLPELPF